MPRPERPLDSQAGPIQAFAADLRLIRKKAGNPTYLKMARQSGRSRTALAEAAGGDHLATWETVEGYLTACAQDPAAWRERWQSLRAELDRKQGSGRSFPTLATSLAASAAAPVSAAPPRSAPRPWLRWLIAATSLGVAGAGVLFGLLSGHASSANGRRANGGTAKGPVTVVVQNKVAIGATGLFEDNTPAYLSSKTVPFCSREGCEVARTQMHSGAVLQALCQQQGTTMTNEDAASPGIQRNSGAATSSRWYLTEMPTGVRGYISEVYLTAASRGGLGLPSCPP